MPNKPLYNLEVREVLELLRTSPNGLSAAEAAARLRRYGPNTLKPKKESLIKRVIEPFANAFALVLLGALILSVVEGSLLDALIIGIIVSVNALIYYLQQYSVSRVIKTLKSHDISYVNVMRGGQTVRLASESLTCGDIILIEEGIKIPADGRIIVANQIEADESMLTGESLPLHKQAGALTGEKRLYEQRNMLFKGTYIKTGSGLMVVTGVGNSTELGGITSLAARADFGRSPIQTKIDSFTKRLLILIVIATLATLALAILRGVNLEEALHFSIAALVSAVPEELPIALTIVLLFGARRMAKVNALVKKISSIETMGAITMIATDKTGTITQNILSVADKFTTHNDMHTFDKIIKVVLNGPDGHGSDPLDIILHDSVRQVSAPAEWGKVHEFTFNQGQRVSGVLWRHPSGYALYIKGAPERILSHCAAHQQSDPKILNTLNDFTGKGYRTIAFAHKNLPSQINKIDSTTLTEMHFDGFVGLADQLRANVSAAVADAKNAGIKVVMLTGDHVNTAAFIAKQVGIATDNQQISDSHVLEAGDNDQIRQRLQTARVFGRVLPEYKYALLKATKNTEITAMTGDGVNDIPALVEADAGIAMGSGSDATKDASDIVLLDDNFHTIVAAVRAGRTALANIRKMLVYLIGTTAGEVLTMLLSLAFGMPLPVLAIQILWINLITDSFTVIPLGLSPSEPRQMLQPPPSPQAPLLNTRQITRIIVMGTVMSASVLAIYYLNLSKGEAYARTLAFVGLIVVQWANALNVNFEYKSWLFNFVRPNKLLLGALILSATVQALVFLTPFGSILHLTNISWTDALVAIVIPSAAVLISVDIHKFIWHKVAKRRRHNDYVAT